MPKSLVAKSLLSEDSDSDKIHHFNVSEVPRNKERTVAYVIQKVATWRRLYNGYYDQDFNHCRLSLEDAAD